MRIMALTEAVDSDDDSDNEIQVTREAEVANLIYINTICISCINDMYIFRKKLQCLNTCER